MIVRYHHTDRDAAQALARAVEASTKTLVVTQVKGPRALPIESLTPYREILAAAGERIDLFAVIDEGEPEGMWRDPMRDLCERLYSDPKEAALASSGMVVIRGGKPVARFLRDLWDPELDAERVTELLSTLDPEIRPYQGAHGPVLDPETPSSPTEDLPLPEETESDIFDPFATLGLGPEASIEDAKKAWRLLIQQYHPDKYASMPPEAQALAERRSREINAAFTIVERLKKGA